jgi:tetratricopeptide (TPR) repeat protein
MTFSLWGCFMNCKSCGAELKENIKFCPQCGIKVEPDICPKCNAPIKAGVKFCPQCGTKVNAQGNDLSPTEKAGQRNPPSTPVQHKKVEVSPDDITRSEELIIKGSKLIDKEKYDEALKVLNESISLNPNNYLAFFARGKAYESVEEYDKAISDYTEAIRLDPSDKNSYFCRGRSYLGKEECEKAIPDFNEYIANNHTEAYAFNFRGNAYYGSGDYSSAIKDYNRAISLKPKDKEFMKTLQANLQNAEDALQNESNDEEDDADESVNKGRKLIDKEKYDEAIKVLNESISLSPDNYLAFFWRGRAYEAVEEYDKAIGDYTEAIRLDPSDKDSYYCRGGSYLSNEEYEKAISDFNEYIATNHTNANAFNLRGNAYHASGDYSSAIKDYNKAIKLEPENEVFKENLQGSQAALQNEGNDDDDEEEDVEGGLIKCENCNTIITIEPNSFAMNADYECPNCNEEVSVSFWGFCDNCNEIVGFHHYSAGKTLLTIGKTILEGFLADENEVKKLKKDILGRVFSKIVNAAEFGECPFCEREYLLCPECGKTVRWPLNSDDNAVVQCECGTKMRHP